MTLPALFGAARGTTSVRADVVAALTVWAVLVPECLAYATIAGVSPVVGLYAAPGALLLYAAFGSSRHLVVGPMSATAALSAAIIADIATDDTFMALTAGLAICTGVVGIVAGVVRLGFLASFISEPVLKGFIVGLALTIIVGQVPKLLGIEGSEGNFFERAIDIVTNLGDLHGTTFAVGAGSLAVVALLRRFAPIVPSSLAAVALGVAVVSIFDLDEEGVAIVGSIEPGLPAFGLPSATAGEWTSLLAGSVGVLLIGFAEGLGAAKTYAARAGYEVDPDRELVGLGAANVAAGFSSGMVVNGSLSKTAVNGAAGARSQLSGLAVAGLTIVTLLFLTGLFEDLPEATLAAVVIAAVIELVDFAALGALYRSVTGPLRAIYGRFARVDFIAALAALAGVLFFDTLPGLVIGIAASMVLLLYRVSHPHVAVLGRNDDGLWVDIAREPGAATVDGVVVLRPESALVFANADAVRDVVLAAATDDVQGVVLDCETVPSIDVSAARMLASLATDLERRGCELAVARDVGQVRDVLSASGSADGLVPHPSVDAAVHALAPGGGAPTAEG